jgi:hypothetical protein
MLKCIYRYFIKLYDDFMSDIYNYELQFAGFDMTYFIIINKITNIDTKRLLKCKNIEEIKNCFFQILKEKCKNYNINVYNNYYNKYFKKINKKIYKECWDL